MGTFITDITGRPLPLVISVKRIGDPRERFLSRNGNLIAFDEDSGTGIAYTSVITDANGKPSTKEFTLDCQRPADCKEGPNLQSIIEFNANQIKYQFHGVDVTHIERQIVSESGLIVDALIDIPSSPIVTSPFNGGLANGKYFLRLRGKSCYSEYTNGLEFTITDGNNTLDWWPNYPMFDFDDVSGTYRILVAVDRTGTYPITIKDSGDVVIVSGTVTLSPGEIAIWEGFYPDLWTIDLGPLNAVLVIAEPPAECEEGPELLEVTPISPTQTQFRFHGIDVLQIEWFIRTLADVIEQRGTVAPGGARVTITHDPLSGGMHNLLIKGSSCTSETGIVDNLDFEVASVALNITGITVVQQPDGRYKLTVNFVGGNPNYTITVRSQSNVTLGSFPNTTGSPANVTLPAGTGPQTVKVMVMDASNAVDEETAIILPAPVMKMSFLQAPNFSSTPTETPMPNDGSVFFIGADANFNWDDKVEVPNGGLWDYIEKRLRKKVSGVWVEKSISNATGQPQSYSVGSSSFSERLFMPRTGNSIVIDGLNVFKTAGEWEFMARVRKGGVGGAIVAEITRNWTVASPGIGSGIFLYNRSGATLGSLISEINQTGSSFPKPIPHYDFTVSDFNGASFRGISAVFRLKVGNQYIQKFSNLFHGFAARTTLTPDFFSLFMSTTDVGSSVEIFSQGNQTWEIEFTAYSDVDAQVVIATRKAIFDFTVNTSEPSGYVNQGFKTSVVAGKSFQQRQGLDFGSEILSTGNVKIFYPATRQSINGQKTCYAWPFLNHVRLHADDLEDLLSPTGMALPDGKHEFSIKYHSNVVADYDDIVDGGSLGSEYLLAGEITGISYANSGMDDYFTVTIRTL